MISAEYLVRLTDQIESHGYSAKRAPTILVSMARLTRREAAALVFTAPLLAQSGPPPRDTRQTTPAPQTVAGADGDVLEAGRKLGMIEVPMNVEPAFVFKA